MNHEDWIYVVPHTDCSWSELTRSVHEAFHRLAIERGWDKDYTGIFATNLVRRRMSLQRKANQPAKQEAKRQRTNKKELERMAARNTAARALEELGVATVYELHKKAGVFSVVSWKQWCTVAVKEGFAIYHPGRKAQEDRYEWKGSNETHTNSGPV